MPEPRISRIITDKRGTDRARHLLSASHHPDPDLAFLAVLAIYLILTLAIWLIRPERWGTNRNLLRTVWLLAFAMGAIGAPIAAR